MRRPRLDPPGLPLHVVQRGANRSDVFRDDDDRQFYLGALADSTGAQGVALHGYVLMDNHVHLLVSAGERGAVSRCLQALGRRFVRRHNERWQRSGPLWEGRFHSSVIDSERYFLACLAYVENNPVRAGLVRCAADFAWSSAGHHLGLRSDPFLAEHTVFSALGPDPAARSRRWQEVLDRPIAAATLAAIRDHARQERALGPPEFQARLETELGQPVSLRAVGRPRTRVSNRNVL